MSDCVDSWLYLCILSITMSRLYCCCGLGWWGTIWKWLVWQARKLVGCCSYFRLSSQIAEPGFPANLSWHKSLPQYTAAKQTYITHSSAAKPFLGAALSLYSFKLGLKKIPDGNKLNHLLPSGIFSGAITR